MRKLFIILAIVMVAFSCSKEKDQPAPEMQTTTPLNPVESLVYFNLDADIRSVVNFSSNGTNVFDIYSSLPNMTWFRHEVAYSLAPGEYFSVDLVIDTTGISNDFQSPSMLVTIDGIIDTLVYVPGSIELHYIVQK